MKANNFRIRSKASTSKYNASPFYDRKLQKGVALPFHDDLDDMFSGKVATGSRASSSISASAMTPSAMTPTASIQKERRKKRAVDEENEEDEDDDSSSGDK